MTHERDIERLLDHWFADGPTEAPDRVVDVVADRIGRQTQRPAWRLDWRQSDMTTPFKLATAVAAVIDHRRPRLQPAPRRDSPGSGGPAPRRRAPSPTPIASPVALA